MAQLSSTVASHPGGSCFSKTPLSIWSALFLRPPSSSLCTSHSSSSHIVTNLSHSLPPVPCSSFSLSRVHLQRLGLLSVSPSSRRVALYFSSCPALSAGWGGGCACAPPCMLIASVPALGKGSCLAIRIRPRLMRACINKRALPHTLHHSPPILPAVSTC